MSHLPVQFPSRSGHTLSGFLELPEARKPRAYAIFCHCFTCTSQIKGAVTISRALAREGIAVLRFDFSGLGESEGDFADATFSSNLHDLADAAAFLEKEYEPPQVVIGHSLGGAAALYGAADLPTVRAVATVGAPADPAHVLHLLGDQKSVIEEEGEAVVEIAGRSFRFKRSFIEDLEESCKPDRLKDLHLPILVLHAPGDNTVGIDNARIIFEAAKHPKSFVSLDNADHILSRASDAQYTGAVIAAWAARYLAEEAPATAGENQVVVSTGQEGFTSEGQVRHHAFLADEPTSVGGKDLGPSPYDFLGMALGSCTTMTLQMYARRKGWPLERATVAVSHDKIHARDCEECETESGKVDHFVRELTLEGALSGEQRQRLTEIADRCPVHRTLHSEVQVTTTSS